MTNIDVGPVEQSVIREIVANTFSYVIWIFLSAGFFVIGLTFLLLVLFYWRNELKTLGANIFGGVFDWFKSFFY